MFLSIFFFYYLKFIHRGEIVETNENVVEDPGLINNSPLEDGWLFKIEASNAEEFNELLSEEDYDNLPKEDED